MRSTRHSTRATLSLVTLAALLISIAPTTLAAPADARLEGRVVGLDGRPAVEHRIHLIDEHGSDLAAAPVDETGVYSFRDLPEGEYSLGLELPDGKVAPVAAAPVKLGSGELARRDLKVLRSTRRETDRIAGSNGAVGAWWSGLSTAGKAWTIVAIAVAAVFTADAIDDDDEDNETASSLFIP